MSSARPQRTRAASTWVGIVVATLLLIALVVFIAQNNRSVRLSFFAADGTVSLAVALLVAALSGAAITLLVGSVRILQLRRQVRRGGGRSETPDPDLTHAQEQPTATTGADTYPGDAAPGSATDALRRGEARTEQARRM